MTTKLSLSYKNGPVFGIVGAVENVLKIYSLTLDDCGFAFTDGKEQTCFTITIPKRVNKNFFIAQLSALVYVGPTCRDLY